jgi:peptide deformylase
LRKISENLSHRTLKGDDYALLVERMKKTVSDTVVGGVGIAAPQIGINKRVVVVQRFDKQGEPFEAYPNIYIVKCSEEKQKGPEGCLSVPNERHNVDRFTSVVISYFDVEKGRVVTETIEGFTAVIFQHEVDHLDGVIYTDRVLM